MCLVRYPADRSSMIHLETDEGGATLCGQVIGQIVDHDVATGWPDCSECMKKAGGDDDKPNWLAV